MFFLLVWVGSPYRGEVCGCATSILSNQCLLLWQALELKDLQEVIDLKRAICKAKGLQHLEVIDGCQPKNRWKTPQKWMVKIMENPMNPWMIWGGLPPPIFWFNTQVDGRMVGWIVEVWCVSSMVFVAQHFWKERVMYTTWMSQEVSKWLVNWL